MQIPNSNQCDICADRGPCFYCGRPDKYGQLNALKRLKEYEKEKENNDNTKGKDAHNSGQAPTGTDSE